MLPAMFRSEPARLTHLLCRWVDTTQRNAWLTLVVTLALTLVLGGYAATRIRINFDPNSLFSADLRFQRAIVEFEQYFPVLTNSLLVVVDGETPERMREAAELLRAALDQQKQRFHRAYLPGEDRFFERYGLLYGSVEEVDDFADHMAVIQPVLAELASEPTLPTLTRVVRTGLDAVAAGDVDYAGWDAVLEHIRLATKAVGEGDGSALSWESVLMSGSGFEPTTRTVIVAEPVLDHDRVFAAERSLDATRETAERLGLTPEHGVEIRITGYPALNHEEMKGLAADTAVAGGLSLVLVVLVLFRAFRSARLVLAAAVTLIVGLVWAAAFSVATVRVLNPLSITFGILVIGLGIDFMIHLGMHLVEEMAQGAPVDEAIVAATRDTGVPLTLCAVTTGVGFLAFVPTEFRGVSDLGMAAAGGVVSMLILTLTLFPPLIRLLMTRAAAARLAARGPARGLRLPLASHPRALVAAAVALGLIALPLLPYIELDTNVISFRNPATESVRTFKELLADRDTTPWFLDALVPSLDRAVVLAEAMRALDTVDEVVTLADYVPEEQAEKTEILVDVSLMLGLPAATERRPAAAQLQRQALEGLRDYLVSAPLGDAHALSNDVAALGDALSGFLAQTDAADGVSVAELADVLLDPIPDQISRLQANLDVEPIGRADLPPSLVERMLSADGHARIQAYPSEDLWDQRAMVDFVESIREVWPEITGLPVNLVESARVTWQSLRMALVWATLAISLLLLARWRSVWSAATVLFPLLLAVLLTQVTTVVFDISFNYANVIVLPLLLGIGVDSGIHLVERAAQVKGDASALLDSTTARAVLFSAITTVASFGTLTLSAHRGVASLGMLLVVGMIWTLAANLILLPAILAMRSRAGSRAGS